MTVRQVPAYFDTLVDAFGRGVTGRFVHLGYWPAPPVEGGTLSADDFAQAQQRLDALLTELAAPAANQAILDVGCGFGGTLQGINQRLAGMRLAGVNIDPRQLAICAQLPTANGNRLEWREADACNLPFADASFDAVLCIEAMFHFRSRRDFFREAARVLKPGGRLVCSDITVTPATRQLAVPSFCIEAPLQDAYGPWPDFWCEDADHQHLAAAAGLRCATALDISAQTLPSHRYTTPRDADELHDSGNPALRAALMLRWLHREGYLRYDCWRFDKPAS